MPHTLRSFTRRHRWAAAVLLGGAGFVLNMAPLPLSPGIDLVFGGVAVLLAAVALGPAPGLVAAIIAGSRTVWLWGHPWAWLIFSLEGLAVGWLAQRRGHRPIVAVLVFWIVLGAPLAYLFYSVVLGLPAPALTVILLKQPFNALVNAVAVEALLLMPALRGALGLARSPQLRSTLAVVVVVSAVVPALAFGVWSGGREWSRNVERARERVQLTAEAHAARLEQYVRLHEQAVGFVADGVERRGEWVPEQLERLVTGERQEFPGFAKIYVADSRGRIAAVAPRTDDQGRPLVGIGADGPDYLAAFAAAPGSIVSDVRRGLAGVPGPMVGIASPIFLGDTLAGFAYGALGLQALPAPRPAPGPHARLVVADRAGTVVYDSRRPYGPGHPPRSLADSVAFHAVSALDAAGVITFLRAPGEIAAAREAARTLAGVAPLPTLGWWTWVEQDFSAVQAEATESHVRLLGLLTAVVLLALAFSGLLARALARPLLRIRTATGALAAGDRGARVGALPPSTPTEIAELGRDFDGMARALVGRTEELEELGEISRALASTLDADEVLRQVTDATTRLVRADGCGIALLAPGGRTLRAGYSVGLLDGAAGREFDAAASLPGAVAGQDEPVLIGEAASDPRVRSDYLDPARTGSVICAPLAGRSGPLGTLTAVRGRGEDPFTRADLRLVERLARQAAIAVENAHLMASERKRAEESESIRRIARTVSEVQGLDETLAVVTREAARIVGADVCRVLLLRSARDCEPGAEPGGATAADELEVVAVAGPDAASVGMRVPVRGRLLESPLLHGRPAIVSDGEFAAAVPLGVREETLGVLTAHREGAPFLPADAGLLAAFADHAAVALRNARLLDAAQAASRAKSDFIATMSHELRTPLNAVLGHLQLLEMEIHGPLTEPQREAVTRIETASRHLRGLIEEVLSFARLEAGRVTVRVDETDLGALAAEVAAVIEPLAAEKSVQFSLDVSDPAAVVFTDPDKVRQILINLAGNAVKFTERGEVCIAVSGGGEGAEMRVRDTGPGIAPEDRVRLFRPFEQLESGFSRSHGGTGLGLYLSGRYAAMIGGRIEVESTPGVGSEFTLVLPRRPEVPEEVLEVPEVSEEVGAPPDAAPADERPRAEATAAAPASPAAEEDAAPGGRTGKGSGGSTPRKRKPRKRS
jgi:signal transduction histidine kinase